MVTDEIRRALNDQINAELYSAYMYMSMSLDACSKDLPGIGNWFFVQAKEEEDHARIIERYMCAQGVRVELKPLPAVKTEWKNAREMFHDALLHEVALTQEINNIAKMATRVGDYATLISLQWFVSEQVEEESSARTMLNSLEMAADNMALLYAIDKELAHRRYSLASPLKQ